MTELEKHQRDTYNTGSRVHGEGAPAPPDRNTANWKETIELSLLTTLHRLVAYCIMWRDVP